MGCGCAKDIQTSGPALAKVDDGTFKTEAAGTDIKHESETRRIGEALSYNAGHARTLFAMQPVEGQRIKDEPNGVAIADAAKRINKEKHKKAISLAQIERTRAAMCFACPAVSSCGTRCLLMASHLPDVDAIDVGPIRDRAAFVSSNAVADIAKHGYACPLNRHPQGEDQVTRWLGLSWYGVPEPLRWLIAVRRWKNDTLDKCGCCVVLKSLSKRWGFGWLSVLEKLPELRKDMAKKKVFKGGPARFKGRAWRYLKWRAKRTLQG